jgi:hypothetical protein
MAAIMSLNCDDDTTSALSEEIRITKNKDEWLSLAIIKIYPTGTSSGLAST